MIICVKGIVHPKMKTLSSFALCVSVFSWTQRKISWRTAGTSAPLTSTVEQQKQSTVEVNGAEVPAVLQDIVLCVQLKTETHTGLRMSNWWLSFHLWVDYSFNILHKLLVMTVILSNPIRIKKNI